MSDRQVERGRDEIGGHGVDQYTYTHHRLGLHIVDWVYTSETGVRNHRLGLHIIDWG